MLYLGLALCDVDQHLHVELVSGTAAFDEHVRREKIGRVWAKTGCDERTPLPLLNKSDVLSQERFCA